MDALTLDQIRVFIAIAEAGSFSRAAKALNRAQSAVTHAIQRLEAETETPLFDRSAYRPTLTEAGKALLERGRRIMAETALFRDHARSLARGLESELSIAIDPLFPMPVAVEALKAFCDEFPNVPVRVHMRSLGAGAQLVIDGTCVIGLLPFPVVELTTLTAVPLFPIELLPVAAPTHPLAAQHGRIPSATLHDHIQLVLTDATSVTEKRDFGVLSSRTWRLADLGAKKSLLVAGMGWGNMPAHMVRDELADGSLVRLDTEGFDPLRNSVFLGVATSPDRVLGPAGSWLVDLLQGMRDGLPR
jgi:DNA-binding transcriptional LysR family regulator